MKGRPVSPCVSVCALGADDICIGCFRTGTEISRWGEMTDDEKRRVLAAVAQRERGAIIGGETGK